MKKEDFFDEEFLKQFKNSKEFGSFIDDLYSRGVEKMLEGELDAHLGYEKHRESEGKNARNGFGKKTIKTKHGETQIQVPRDRDGSFEPVLVPKRSRLSEGIESLIISLYAKGMNNSDIEEQIRELYDFNVSTSTISRITDAITNDVVAWKNRPL